MLLVSWVGMGGVSACHRQQEVPGALPLAHAAVPNPSASASPGDAKATAVRRAPRPVITGPVYGQQLVDPGRTGLERVDLRLPLTRRWDLTLPMRRSSSDETCWLLATARRAAVQCPEKTFFVDWKQRAVARSRKGYLGWVALSPDSTLVKDDGFEFLRRPHFWPTGSTVELFGDVLGARATKTTLHVLLQGYPTPETELWRFPWHYPAQQPYTKGVLQWHRSGSASSSPFGPDGSVVVVLDDKLVVLDEAGSVEREIPGRVLAGCVSIDKHRTIYAFQRSNGSTRLIMLAGKQRSSVDLGSVEPVQPPVLLPGGAVRVIAKTGVLGIDGGVVRWRWSAGKQRSAGDSESKPPLATATRNGYVVVRDQRRVVALDKLGKVVWQAPMPEPIVSNPLVTAEGGVCVVWWREMYFDHGRRVSGNCMPATTCHRSVYDTLTCLFPAQASP